MTAYDDTTDEGNPPVCEGRHGCDAEPVDVLDMVRLTGNEGAPMELHVCAWCAKWTVEYWRREAAAERI